MKVWTFALFLFVLITACHKEVKTNDSIYARELFKQSANTIKSITQELRNAQDSTNVDSLFMICEKRISDINLRVPSNTDFNLTEEENDSLFLLISEFRHLKDSKLKEFAVVSDSVRDE